MIWTFISPSFHTMFTVESLFSTLYTPKVGLIWNVSPIFRRLFKLNNPWSCSGSLFHAPNRRVEHYVFFARPYITTLLLAMIQLLPLSRFYLSSLTSIFTEGNTAGPLSRLHSWSIAWGRESSHSWQVTSWVWNSLVLVPASFCSGDLSTGNGNDWDLMN